MKQFSLENHHSQILHIWELYFPTYQSASRTFYFKNSLWDFKGWWQADFPVRRAITFSRLISNFRIEGDGGS